MCGITSSKETDDSPGQPSQRYIFIPHLHFHPLAIRRLMSCTCGLSRKSSVPALKLYPSRDLLLPISSTISIARSILFLVLGISDSKSGSFKSSSLAL